MSDVILPVISSRSPQFEGHEFESLALIQRDRHFDPRLPLPHPALMKQKKEMIDIDMDMERRTILSTLWIFVLLNMVYADILGMLRPGYLESLE